MDDFEHDESLAFLYGNHSHLSPVERFNQGELFEKIFKVMTDGKLLGTVVQQKYYVLYYRLYDFYACVFHHLGEDCVSSCHAFDDPGELDPLWDQLDMDAFALKKE